MDKNTPCKCGHIFDVHDHNRRGTDCSKCDRGVCDVFKRRFLLFWI